MAAHALSERLTNGVPMRQVIVPAAIVAAATVLLEGIAAFVGWSPAIWVLAALSAAAGVAAFLVAGRLRALHLRARRRARVQHRRAGVSSATVRRLTPEPATAAVAVDRDGRPDLRRL
jgi:hypothetical protein